MNLRELLAKATGAQWETNTFVKVYAQAGESDPPRIMIVSGEDIIAEVYRPDIAALIVALHNCADELLKVAEAAEVFANYACELKDGETCDCHNCRLRAALREKEGKL